MAREHKLDAAKSFIGSEMLHLSSSDWGSRHGKYEHDKNCVLVADDDRLETNS